MPADRQDRANSSHLAAARSFMASHARVLDRRRFELLFDGADAERVLPALRAYRNPDGGYGHGLEPDLRAPESQPAAALHAFEVFADVAPVRAPEAVELCDWLDRVALPALRYRLLVALLARARVVAPLPPVRRPSAPPPRASVG